LLPAPPWAPVCFHCRLNAAGMWFSWSTLLLALTWFFMYHSSLMIMEVNLNYEPGASFDTFVRDTLGPRWNLFNSLTLTFVLYILTYAYVSGGGSIVSHTLSSVTGIHLPGKLAGLIFAVGLAAFVWFSTA
jgi:tryptophan-specific transport protein